MIKFILSLSIYVTSFSSISYWSFIFYTYTHTSKFYFIHRSYPKLAYGSINECTNVPGSSEWTWTLHCSMQKCTQCCILAEPLVMKNPKIILLEEILILQIQNCACHSKFVSWLPSKLNLFWQFSDTFHDESSLGGIVKFLWFLIFVTMYEFSSLMSNKTCWKLVSYCGRELF